MGACPRNLTSTVFLLSLVWRWMYFCRRSTRSGLSIEFSNHDGGGPEQLVTDHKPRFHNSHDDPVLGGLTDLAGRDSFVETGVKGAPDSDDGRDAERLELCEELTAYQLDAPEERIAVGAVRPSRRGRVPGSG